MATAATTKTSELFWYAGYHGSHSYCDIDISVFDAYTLVVATERDDNPGASITNRAEVLATEVCRARSISPQRLMWIERYPERGSGDNRRPATWDYVTFGFDWRTGEFREPRWRSIPKAAVDALMAGELAEGTPE